MTGRLWLGTSSWNYPEWIGPFYPGGTAAAQMLALYSQVFPSVEADATFYGIPRATTIEAWRDRTTGGFRMSFKTPARVSHEQRFVGCAEYFAAFIGRVRLMADKLGAILIQCPPDFAPAPPARKALFTFLETELPPDIQVALELRHPGWYDAHLFDMAEQLGCTLTLTEGSADDLELAGRIADQLVARQPAGHAYIRLLGEGAVPSRGRVERARSASLDRWAGIIRRLREVCSDVYVYASNEYEGYAPHTAGALLGRLREPVPLVLQLPGAR